MLFKTNSQTLGLAGDVSKLTRYDAKLEALIPVIERKIPLKAHAHRKDDIFTAIRIAKECGVELTLEHVTAGGEIVSVLAEEGYPIAVAPYFNQPQKAKSAKKILRRQFK